MSGEFRIPCAEQPPPQPALAPSAAAAVGSAAAAAAVATAAGVTTDTPGGACWCCLEVTLASTRQSVLRGCACRGSSGWVHVDCLAQAAQITSEVWMTCPTCKQDWHGELLVQLCRAHCRLTDDGRPKEDPEKVMAALELIYALRENDELAESLQLGRSTLEVCRRNYGDEHGATQSAMSHLASTHARMDNPALALPLERELLAVRQRLGGSSDLGYLSAAGNLALTLKNLGNYAESLPLFLDVLCHERSIMSRGDASPAGPHTVMLNLAGLHNAMGNHQLAVDLSAEVWEIRQRVLGSQHPETLTCLERLGASMCMLGDYAAGLPMLRAALDGLTAVCGSEHSSTLRAHSELHTCFINQADEALDA